MGLPQAQQLLTYLQSSSYGYISGSDLSVWCDPQLLISANNRLPTATQRAVAQAISEVQSALQNRYDLTTELLKTDVLPPVAVSKITAGAVSAIEAVLPGSGLTVAPGVTVVNDPTDTVGTGCTVTAITSPGVVQKIYLLSCGRHYRQAPIVTIVGGGGTGATAVATIDGFGHVNSVMITDPGTGYTSIPQITFAPVDGFGFGSSAVAAILFGRVTGYTITAPGTGYTAAPSLVFDMSTQGPDLRNPKLVKIATIYAVRNVMGQAQSVSETMQAEFKMADVMIDDIKAGLDSLPLFDAAREIRSDVKLISDSFHSLG